MECAEVDWLRKATLRNHNSLAAIGQAPQAQRSLLGRRRHRDEHERAIAHHELRLQRPLARARPKSVCCLLVLNSVITLTSDAMLLESCKSGVVFDCFASEGFWVFMGLRNSGSYRMFGTELRVAAPNEARPSKTVRHHSLFPAREQANVVGAPSRLVQDLLCDDIAANVSIVYHITDTQLTGFLFPHADFVQALTKLGYSINDCITNLMPIVSFCEDE
jgi:hypothetical protein